MRGLTLGQLVILGMLAMVGANISYSSTKNQVVDYQSDESENFYEDGKSLGDEEGGSGSELDKQDGDDVVKKEPAGKEGANQQRIVQTNKIHEDMWRKGGILQDYHLEEAAKLILFKYW